MVVSPLEAPFEPARRRRRLAIAGCTTRSVGSLLSEPSSGWLTSKIALGLAVPTPKRPADVWYSEPHPLLPTVSAVKPNRLKR